MVRILVRPATAESAPPGNSEPALVWDLRAFRWFARLLFGPRSSPSSLPARMYLEADGSEVRLVDARRPRVLTRADVHSVAVPEEPDGAGRFRLEFDGQTIELRLANPMDRQALLEALR